MAWTDETVTAPLSTLTVPLRTVVRENAAAGRAASRGVFARVAPVARVVAVLCLLVVLLVAAADLLPDDAMVGVLTPLRLVLLIGVVAAWAALLAAGPAGPTALRTPLDLPVAALVGAGALATLLAGQAWSPWRGLLTTAVVFALTVAVRRLLPDSGPAFGLAALLAVAVAATTAAQQSANGTPTGFCRGALDGSADVCTGAEMVRATGTFANPNLLAAFLVLLLPVAAGGVLALADRTARLVGAAVVALGYVAVLLTGSRGGVLAAAAGVVAFVVLRRPTRRTLLAAAAAAALGVAGLVLVTGGQVGVRADVWGAAARIVAADPPGAGTGRAGALLDAAIPGDEAFQHAHNLWLNWAVEAGLPGLLAALAVTVMAAVTAVRAAAAGSRTAVAAGAGLAGFAVMSLADHPAGAQRLAIALAVVLALVAAEAAPSWVRTRPASGQPADGVVSSAERSRSGSR